MTVLADLACRQDDDLVEFGRLFEAAMHELRAPARTLTVFARLLTEDLASGNNAAVAEDVEFILDGSGHLRRLLDGLSELWETTSRPLKLKLVSPKTCVELALGNLREQVEATAAEVTLGALPSVWADERLLVLTFERLIDNSLKFCRQKPVIEIRRGAPGSSTLTVYDNGIGVRSSFAEQVFEPFQRLNELKEHPGSGLGLTICRCAIERLSGRIRIDADVTEGTLVRIDLPGRPGNVEAPKSSAAG